MVWEGLVSWRIIFL